MQGTCYGAATRLGSSRIVEPRGAPRVRATGQVQHLLERFVDAPPSARRASKQELKGGEKGPGMGSRTQEDGNDSRIDLWFYAQLR
ncbi:hypothetical protein BV898_11792 [Hypsibius exemplaris]|uniref:Uncharacterized protein n=1 Tax=Hypsibius exemplaris TaxID=2072580 RepID=A0A1W0WFQ3_HYPEX|nr:hypothetical protein BV898_11792 [Hypsibius exemplaris]